MYMRLAQQVRPISVRIAVRERRAGVVAVAHRRDADASIEPSVSAHDSLSRSPQRPGARIDVFDRGRETRPSSARQSRAFKRSVAACL